MGNGSKVAATFAGYVGGDEVRGGLSAGEWTPVPGGKPATPVAASRFRLPSVPRLSDVSGRWAHVLRVVYLALAVLVAAYVVSVVVRGRLSYSTTLDGWGVDALELVGSGLCLARAAVRRPGRLVAFALGSGVLCWSLGDTLVTAQQGATPSLGADVFYLLFYLFTYWAIVLVMRKELSKAGALGWLDGAVAGLGAAAVCAAFAFRGLAVRTPSGSALTTAMNLAYPIGDVLLLALVVGGTAMFVGYRRSTWVLVGVACGINAIGDTFNFAQSAASASTVGYYVNAVAWPIAILLISAAVWMQAGRTRRADTEALPGFALPVLAAAAGIAILTIGSVGSIGRIAISFAAAALVLAAVRMTISMTTLRSITLQRHRQSVTDDLTGLGNRRYLLQAFDGYAQESVRTERSMALLFVDLDGFKEVNDSFGHAAGDHILRQIGPRLASALRPTDVLVRLGGDEFAVLLPSTGRSRAIAVAERIAYSLKAPFMLDLIPVTVNVSTGIAMAPGDATNLAELLRCADRAMYRAKVSRAPIQVYDQTVDDDGDLVRLMEELRVAVAEGQLVLHFQPQLDLRTGSISTVEALVRWDHPRLGMVAPLKFLPLAEEAGLMPAITERVLNDSLAQCEAWRAQGRRINVSVNVSPSNLLATGFVDLVGSALARRRLPGDALLLEITETCIISDYQRTREVIDALRHKGVQTAIDDFGAGFTSLAYLSNLAVTEMKLDQTFIADLSAGEDPGQRPRGHELVRATIGLGHALGLRVVAEGVETQETLDLLASLGCDLAQGFLIGRPVPPALLSFTAPTLVAQAQDTASPSAMPAVRSHEPVST